MIEREEKAMRRAYIKQIITTVLLIVMVLNGVVLESLALMNETQKETTKEGMITPDSPKYTEYVMKEDGLKEVNEKEGESPNAYVAKTLLVLTKEGVTDTYQATTYLQYGELWILQYNTEREPIPSEFKTLIGITFTSLVVFSSIILETIVP